MSRFCFCNCPAGFSAEPERHAPDCPGRSGAGKARTPVPATTPALKVTAAEELDAVLHWRNKHAVAIKERDALQQRLTAADERSSFVTDLMIRCAQNYGDGADKYIMRDINHYLATGSMECRDRRTMDVEERNPGLVIDGKVSLGPKNSIRISDNNVKISGPEKPYSVTKIKSGEYLITLPMPDTVAVAPVENIEGMRNVLSAFERMFCEQISSGPLTELVVNARLLLRAPKQASRCSGCDGIGVHDFNANGSYVICEHCQRGTSFSAWKRPV